MAYPTKAVTGIWVAINLLHRGLHRRIDAALKAEGLPPLRWYDVLWELEQEDAGLRPFEIERLVIFEQSNLSRTVQRLIEDGLVSEKPFRQDGRGKVLQITAKGRETRAQMWRIYGPMIQAHIGEVEKAHDADAVATALTALIDFERRALRREDEADEA